MTGTPVDHAHPGDRVYTLTCQGYTTLPTPSPSTPSRLAPSALPSGRPITHIPTADGPTRDTTHLPPTYPTPTRRPAHLDRHRHADDSARRHEHSKPFATQFAQLADEQNRTAGRQTPTSHEPASTSVSTPNAVSGPKGAGAGPNLRASGDPGHCAAYLSEAETIGPVGGGSGG